MDNYLNAIDRTVNIWGEFMLKNPNIVAVGRGNKRVNGEMIKNKPTITVFVKRKLANSAIEKNQRIPRYFKGIETDVYEREIDSKLDKFGGVKLRPDLKPAFGGGGIAVVRGNIMHYGTLTYAFTNKGKKDKLYALSSAHTFTRGVNPMKPGGIVSYIRGTDDESTDKAWKLGIFLQSKTQQYLENDIDVALIYIGENNSQINKLIAPGLLNDKIISGIHVVTQEDINNKEKVYKIGLVTGYTEGEILAIKVVEKLYSPNDNITIIYRNQIYTTLKCDIGDSGALGIIKRTEQAFGMQNAAGDSESVFSEINTVLDAFNIEFLI